MNLENIEDIYELSPAQQGMLFQSLSSRKRGLYFEQFCCAIQGNLDVPGFERAWQQVIDRHSSLRASFHVEDLDKPLQIIHQRVELPWEQSDWRGLSPVEQQERMKARLEADEEQGCDLSLAPLMRLTLIRVADDAYHFIWSHHHLLLDGWSLPVVLQEVFAFYDASRRGQSLRLEPSRPYRDYIAWLQEQDPSAAEAFWRKMLMNFRSPLSLARVTDFRKATDKESSFGERQITLSAETTGALQSFAQRHQLTLNTLIQGAWALLLSRYTGADDVVFGTTVSGRPAALAGVETMVGLFINTLPVRAQVSPETSLLPWLKKLQDDLFEVRHFEHTSLGQVQEWSDAPRGLPLFESIVVFGNYPLDAALLKQSASLEIRNAHVIGGRTNYPLTVMVEPGVQMALRIIYDSHRFRGFTIIQMLNHFQSLLEEIIARPDQKLSDLPHLKKQTIAIASTFTAEPLHEVLAFWMQLLDAPSTIEFAFGKHLFSEQSDPSTLPDVSSERINVILLRLEDLEDFAEGGARKADSPSESWMKIEQKVTNFICTLKSAAERSRTPFLVGLCPPSPTVMANEHELAFHNRMEERVVSELEGVSGVCLVTTFDLAASYPVSSYYGSEINESGSVSFTPAFFSAIGTLIARRIFAIQTIPYKAVVLCDVTLWKGLSKEDGSLGVEIAPGQKALQELMVAEHENGMFICVCSENNEEDVVEVFERSPAMTLRREHLASWRTNWRPKSENIHSLAAELGLGLENFIFIDNDPIECAEVQANCPQVLVLQLPQESDDISQFLNHVWALDRLREGGSAAKRSCVSHPKTGWEVFQVKPAGGNGLPGTRAVSAATAALPVNQLAAKSALLNWIATELSDTERILKAVRSLKRTRTKAKKAFDAPQTPIEKGLAKIWMEFLDLPQVSVHDNFFDLGGHSLLATRIISQVRETFQVEVPLKLLFTTAFTVGALAKAIEQNLIEQEEAEDVAETLSELNALTDEQVKALLLVEA